jgi:hypothetical protein
MKYTLIKDNETDILFEVWDTFVWIDGETFTTVEARERWKDYIKSGYTYSKSYKGKKGLSQYGIVYAPFSIYPNGFKYTFDLSA